MVSIKTLLKFVCFSILVINLPKTACEILDDATLVAYYSFDSGSVEDSGPNYINGTVTSGVINVPGHINEGLAFGLTNAYFYFGGLVALGISNQAFSFSLWIQPTANIGGGTILHVANGPDGFDHGGSAWCMPFMGFDSDSRLTIQGFNGYAFSVIGPTLSVNEWTHVAQTYSYTNGITLYINGIQVGTSGSTSYSASGIPNYVFVGYYGPLGCTCTTDAIIPGVFYGAVDELRLYSRELSASDVCVLANQ